AKVMAIEELKDLSSLALDKLIGNLKVHELVMEKDSKIYKDKKERVKSIALKAKKESSNDETCLIAQSTNKGRQDFDNEVKFGVIVLHKALTHNFSAPRTPQSNGVVERKNRTLQEMSRTMLNAVDTASFSILRLSPRFDPKSYECVFLRYSQNSKACVVLNKHTMKVEESLNVTFDESRPPTKLSPLVDDDVGEENPKTTHLEAVKRIFRYIRGTSHLGLWYPKGTEIETIVYADSNHAGYYVDRKSTSGVYTFMGCCLTSWFAKKQTALAISTTEAEYVSAGKAGQQALWMKQALIDYGIRLDDVPIMCDNKGAIDLSKNPCNTLELNI
ncbi:copia protein, partial [Tanacetum coccineum]